jgi:hypothetical protein
MNTFDVEEAVSRRPARGRIKIISNGIANESVVIGPEAAT